MILGQWTPTGFHNTSVPVAVPQPRAKPVDLRKKYIARWDLIYSAHFRKPKVPTFRKATDGTT